MQKIKEIRRIEAIFRAFWISVEFDIVRYVLISLTSFGHNLGTVKKSYSAITGYYGGDEIRA